MIHRCILYAVRWKKYCIIKRISFFLFRKITWNKKVYVDMNHQKRVRHIYSSPGTQCDQNYFLMSYYSKTIQTTCSTSLCNSYDFASQVAEMKCESNETKENMSLEIPFRPENLNNATKYCYYCNECENPIEDMIKIDCNPYNFNVSFSCQVIKLASCWFLIPIWNWFPLLQSYSTVIITIKIKLKYGISIAWKQASLRSFHTKY